MGDGGQRDQIGERGERSFLCPLIGVLTNTGHALVKKGGLFAEWVDVFGGVNRVVVGN